MSDMSNTELTAATARELLDAADSGRHHGDALSSRSILGPALSVFIGLIMGGFLMAAVYVLPTATPLEALLVVVGYSLGIALSVVVYNLGRRITPIGWMDRYQKGLAISCGVFFTALALSFLIGERSLFLWIPLAIATVIPIAFLGTKRQAR
jgi:hypothetical protein